MRGILINKTVHTGNNLNIVMTYKDTPAPTPRTYTVEVPGRNGLLDMSEFLTGEISYNNRTLTFKFVGDGSRETVLSLIDTMLKYHGQNITVTTDDYPDWYYEGRATVKYTDKGHYVEFELSVDAYPFRRTTATSVVTHSSSAKVSKTLINEGIASVPVTVTVTSASAYFMRKGITYNLSTGVYPNLFIIEPGTNTVTAQGNIKFEWSKGEKI